MSDDPAGRDEPNGLVAVGRIGRAHGVRGSVFVEPWTDAPDERFRDGAILHGDPTDAGARDLTVESTTTSGGKFVVHFAGVDSREGADALRGVTLHVAAADRPVLDDPDEFYDSDLIGLAAATIDGRDLGPIRDVLHAPGADYLVVHVEGQERLIPLVSAVVPTIDVAGGRVVVDPPDGLFDL